MKTQTHWAQNHLLVLNKLDLMESQSKSLIHSMRFDFKLEQNNFMCFYLTNK